MRLTVTLIPKPTYTDVRERLIKLTYSNKDVVEYSNVMVAS